MSVRPVPVTDTWTDTANTTDIKSLGNDIRRPPHK
jgi:hypothetical protein